MASGVQDRDGSLVSNSAAPGALIATLLQQALKTNSRGRLSVLDFGGALGSSYRLAKPWMEPLDSLTWHIVEQPGFVETGRRSYESDELRFFASMEEAATASTPDIILFSGVLQYLDNPYEILERAKKLGAETVFVDRNPKSEVIEDKYTLQYVPGGTFTARLPFRIFGKQKLEEALSPEYILRGNFASVDPDMTAGGMPVSFLGSLFTASDGPQQP